MKLIVTSYHIVACLSLVNSVVIREKRNSSEETNNSDPSSRQDQSCAILLRQCKNSENCREAIRNLKMKCTVKLGKCNAEMYDLQDCAQAMDIVKETYFQPEDRCVCDQRKGSRCSHIYKVLYENPCFASVRYLREKNMMPHIEGISKANPDFPAQHSVTPPPRDFVDELMELILVNDDDVTTISMERDEQNTKDPNKMASTTLRNETDSSKNTELHKNNLYQTEKTSNNAGQLLLYVVLAVVGVLIAILLLIGGGLIFYFWLFRRGRRAKKGTPSK